MNGARSNRSSLISCGLSCLLLPLLLATCGAPPAADSEYVAEIEAWQQRRIAGIGSPDGWLTVVDLVWLEPGVNRVGGAPDSTVVLPGDDVPGLEAELDLHEDGSLVLRPGPESDLVIDGEPATERPLATDHDGEPTVVERGSVSFYPIKRGDQVAVRVKDRDSEARTNFKGLVYYPIDPTYRVTATFESYPEPRRVLVPSAQGPDQPMLIPGRVRFTLRGAECALEPLISSPEDDELMFVFRDTTSGRSTYGAGRFLYASAPASGSDTVVLDFNRAYSPPCAFTAYATCPLPPPGNTLPIAVEAGEKDYGAH